MKSLRIGKADFNILNDPLHLAEHKLLMPADTVRFLKACNGTRTVTELAELIGGESAIETATAWLVLLDEARLLANNKARLAATARLAAFRQRPERPLAHAGSLYPAKAEVLGRLFANLTTATGRFPKEWQGSALISPHIDYHRGGQVYAALWQQAATMVAEAELIVILGTDHWGKAGQLSLTSQPYEPPFNQLPTDAELVADLVHELGPHLLDDELHHFHEHAIEMTTNWIGYYRPVSPCPILPILCGPLDWSGQNNHYAQFAHTLKQLVAGRQVLYVASVDLAHVGPAFGSTDPTQNDQWQRREQERLALLQAGQARAWFDHLAATRNQDRVCGAGALTLLFHLLDGLEGKLIRYQQCPANRQQDSFVSIAGLCYG